MNQGETTATKTRALAWDGCLNTRELGGYLTGNQREIRWNAFVRSDSLHQLTPEGEAALIAYGVRTIINLRTDEEAIFAPDAFMRRHQNANGLRTLHLPIIDSSNLQWQQGETQVASMFEMYRLMLDAFGSQFAAVMKAIAQAKPGTVAFYCHAGKDRTGLVTALLLALVDVPAATIAADYAISDQNLGPLYADLRAVAEDAEELERLVWMLQSLPESMMATLAYLDRQYGGAEGYLLTHGVTSAEIERIRQRLLA
jgi:protein-tyrosine phosphatase